MLEAVRGPLLRILRVPAEPQIPAGANTRVFRAAPAYFRYRLALWALTQVGGVIGLLLGLFGLSRAILNADHSGVVIALRALEAFALIAFLLQLPLSLLVLRLDFDMRWYILSDRSLRIREGILKVREKTITFANIQHISIRQNPLQRILRIADVLVQTAGGGPSSGGQMGEGMHEAYFHGVDNAEEIRTAIRDRVRKHRDAGLGDPDEPEPMFDVPEEQRPVIAARTLLHEVRELRRALVG